MNPGDRTLPGPCPVPLSLYIHVPFCRSKCGYCDFFSVPNVSEEAMKAVLAEEAERLKYYLDLLRPPSISTLYVGGGTPSCVPTGLWEWFLKEVFDLLPNCPEECSMEANPETLTEDFLRLFQTFSFDRISLGIQTFQESLLRTLNRRASANSNRKALETVRSLWEGSLNVDLLLGVPGQDEESALKDLEEVLQYTAEHLSLYQLTLEENTELFQQVQRGKRLPLSSEEEERVQEAVWKLATERGYVQYEVSNFSLPGFECKHNLRYWELRPYLGIGPSAVSTLPGRDGGIVRVTEVPDIHRYVNSGIRSTGGVGATIETEEIPPPVFVKELFLMGLRTVRGIREDLFREQVSLSAAEVIPRALEKHEAYFVREKGFLTLTKTGRLWLNRILIDIFEEIDRYGSSLYCSWPARVLD